MPFAVAAVGAAAVGGIASAVIGSEASQNAAKKITGAETLATNVEEQQFQQTQANLAPFLNAGTAALPTLQGLLGIGGQPPNPTAFTSSPGYQFMLGQGTQAVQNAASATGGVKSGNTLKSLTQYGQGLANQTYQQYLNNVGGVVGMGQSAANQIGNFGQTTAAEVGQNYGISGSANAAGILGAAQSQIGGINALMKALGGGAGAVPAGGGNAGGGYAGGGNNNAANINLAQLFGSILNSQSTSSFGGGAAPYGAGASMFG